MVQKVVGFIFISCQMLALVNGGTKFSECLNGEKAPIFVDIVGCTTQPCNIKLGSTVTAYVNFTALERTDMLKAKAIVTPSFLPVPVDYPLPQPDACKALTDTHCPLEMNQPAQYKLQMPIDSIFPAIDLRLQIYLAANDVEDSRVVCFEVDCKFVA